MAKGSIEWECSPENGFTLRINPVPGGLARGEVLRHVVSVREEMRLALRGLIDVMVKQTEKKESRANQGVTHIKVE